MSAAAAAAAAAAAVATVAAEPAVAVVALDELHVISLSPCSDVYIVFSRGVPVVPVVCNVYIDNSKARHWQLRSSFHDTSTHCISSSWLIHGGTPHMPL
jgi:hypothetical protein